MIRWEKASLPTSIRHVGTSRSFKWIKYSMTFVCRLLAARWITVWPRASFEPIWAPRETKHWTASKAPDVAESSNGVDLRLNIQSNNICLFG